MKYRPTTTAVVTGLLAAGIAPLACAQTSSVTLFGIVDAYAGRFTGAPTGVAPAAIAAGAHHGFGYVERYRAARL